MTRTIIDTARGPHRIVRRYRRMHDARRAARKLGLTYTQHNRHYCVITPDSLLTTKENNNV